MNSIILQDIIEKLKSKPQIPIVYLVTPREKVILDKYYEDNPQLTKPNYQERAIIT